MLKIHVMMIRNKVLFLISEPQAVFLGGLVCKPIREKYDKKIEEENVKKKNLVKA